MRVGPRYPDRKINEALSTERNQPETKRWAHAGAVYRELAEDGYRYSRTKGPGYHALILVDRAHAFLRRCYCFSRFLFSYLRRYRLSPKAPYAAFLTRGGKVRVLAGPVLASLLPLTRGCFAGSTRPLG